MSYHNPQPDEWFELLDEGLDYRRRFGIEELWGAFEAIYYNTHESMMNDGPNIFMSQGDAMLSTITTPSARIAVRPTKPEEVDTAPIVQALDNVLIRDVGLPEAIETASLHTWLFGRGIIKFGYDSEFGYSPEYDIGGQLQLGLTLTQLTSSGKRRIEYDGNISPGFPWARSVDPRDFVVPWGTWSIETAPWVAHRIVRHIDDVRADRKYNSRDLQPTMTMRDFVNSYRTSQRSRLSSRATDGSDWVEMFEIHDRRSGKIYVVATGHQRFLRNETNVLQIDNQLPFASTHFTPSTRAFWVTPDVYYLYHIQSELSDVARQRTRQRRISTLKFLYDENVISEEELNKILSPDVGAAAKISAGGDMTRAILKLDNQPNMGLAQEEELLRANAREQIGFSRNQLGEYTGGRKTASEVAAVDQSSKLRMSRRGLKIKELYELSIRRINDIVFTFWTLPRYVPVLGDETTQRWAQINGPAIRGRYAYQVTFVDDAALEAAGMQALQLYGMLAQDPTIDPIELRAYLTNAVGDPRFVRLFNADVRSAMSQLPQNRGGVSQNTTQPSGSRGQSAQQLLSGGGGQAGQLSPQGLLAGGRRNP